MKARFVHRVVVFEMSSSWRPEWNKEQKEHSHIGEEKERKRREKEWAWAGEGCMTGCVVGVSHENY